MSCSKLANLDVILSYETGLTSCAESCNSNLLSTEARKQKVHA